MKVKINARFATVEDTAKALGVPLGRAKKASTTRRSVPLQKRIRYCRFESLQTHDWTSLTAASLERKNGSRPHPKSGPLKRKTREKTDASRKRRTRAKVSKASR